jgi:hypothetical protein
VIITKTTLNRLQGIVELGSDEWYLKEIEEAYTDPRRKGYQREELSLYTTRLLRAHAEADYSLLGLHLEGAPDETGAADPFNDIEEVEVGYIPRFNYQPHWLRVDPQVTDFWTFKLYHWIKDCYLEGTNIHNKSYHWLSITETKDLEIESYKVLQAFKKPAVTPTYHPLVQVDLDILSFQYKHNLHNKTIDSNLLILHPVDNLNDYIKDPRPIPCYRRADKSNFEFEFIEVPIIQWYLSKRISEWIAFGGHRLYQTGIHNTRSTGRRAFLRPFYWDLWKDIRTLREEAIKVKTCTLFLQNLWREYKRNQVEAILGWE